jgi:hypothetical protein
MSERIERISDAGVSLRSEASIPSPAEAAG